MPPTSGPTASNPISPESHDNPGNQSPLAVGHANRRRRIPIVVGSVVLALAGVACGGGGEEGVVPPTKAEQTEMTLDRWASWCDVDADDYGISKSEPVINAAGESRGELTTFVTEDGSEAGWLSRDYDYGDEKRCPDEVTPEARARACEGIGPAQRKLMDEVYGPGGGC